MGALALLNFDLYVMLTGLGDSLASLAEKMGVGVAVPAAAAISVALMVGLFGVLLSKVLSATSMGVLGCFFGSGLCNWLLTLDAFSKAPAFLSYVSGTLFAVLFFLLGWKKRKISICLLFALLTFGLVSFYAPFENIFLLLGSALLVGALAGLAAKPIFCAFTALFGGFTLVSLLGVLLPRVSAFRLFGGGWAAVWIAVAFSALFLSVQLIASRNYEIEK